MAWTLGQNEASGISLFTSISCQLHWRHNSWGAVHCLQEGDVLCCWASCSVREKGLARSWGIPEHWPPQSDCLCLLRRGNMNNGKSEIFFLITSLRKQNCGQKFPYYRQSWKCGENRRNLCTLDKKTDSFNDKLHDSVWEFYRDQRSGRRKSAGRRVIEEDCLRAGRTWAISVIHMERTLVFLFWVACSTSIENKLNYVVCFVVVCFLFLFFAKSCVAGNSGSFLEQCIIWQRKTYWLWDC